MTVRAAPGASLFAAALLLAFGHAKAQSSAQSEAGEPRVDTSAPAPGPAARGAVTPSAVTPSAVTPSAVTPSAVTPSAVTPSAVTLSAPPGAATSGAAAPGVSAAEAATAARRSQLHAPLTRSGAPDHPATSASDRLSLGTATVTGDREQPKVMYIVPWKRADIGELSGKPMNSLLDEALAPVDRDEFKREVAYYDAITADAPHNGAQGPKTRQGEK